MLSVDHDSYLIIFDVMYGIVNIITVNITVVCKNFKLNVFKQDQIGYFIFWMLCFINIIKF